MQKIMDNLGKIMIEACERDGNIELAEKLKKYIKREKKGGRLMNLLDKIKLIIEARSFYIKRVRIDDLDLMYGERQIVALKDFVCSHYKVKRILKYTRDERRFGWFVWYI